MWRKKKTQEIAMYDVVQFNEKHKWGGCYGTVERIEEQEGDTRYLVCVPVPGASEGGAIGAAYIFIMKSEGVLERIGRTQMVFVPIQKDESEETANEQPEENGSGGE